MTLRYRLQLRRSAMYDGYWQGARIVGECQNSQVRNDWKGFEPEERSKVWMQALRPHPQPLQHY